PVSLASSCCYFSFLRRPPASASFPYTTLFRSVLLQAAAVARFVPEHAEIVILPFLAMMLTVLFNGRVSMIAAMILDTRPLKSTVDRKSTRLNSSHEWISYAVFCLKKKKEKEHK